MYFLRYDIEWYICVKENELSGDGRHIIIIIVYNIIIILYTILFRYV